MEIEATGDLEVNLGAGAPAYSVELKLRMADGSALPQPLGISLTSDDAGGIPLVAYPGDDGARFDAVTAGRWSVQAHGAPIPLGVVSVQVGADAMVDNRIVVKEKTVTATAVLAEGKTSIEGFAKKDGKGEPGVMIVLVPRNPTASVELFRRDQSDSDGSFALLNVIPGEYTIVAIEDGWKVDWARPEVIARYLERGTPTTVTAKSTPSMRLHDPVEVQSP
jgi:hypothetical protein